jgi:hypothetical protein
MMRSRRVFIGSVRWLAILTVAALAGCGDSTGPAVPQLDLVLVAPDDGDRAAVVTVVGDVSAVHAANGYRLFSRRGEGSLKLLVIAEAGATFPSGDAVVATLEIADGDDASDYRSYVTEVASADYELRSARDYAVRLETRRH